MLFKCSALFSLLSVTFLASACSLKSISLSNESFVVASPISISSGGETFRLNRSDIKELTELSEISRGNLDKFGVNKETDYSFDDLYFIISASLNDRFEGDYLDFYRSVVRPAIKSGSARSERGVREGVVRIVRDNFRRDIEYFLKKFGPADSFNQFEESLSIPSNMGLSSSGDSDNIFFQLEKIHNLVTRIQKAKLRIGYWLKRRTENYSFRRSLRLTIDIVSQNGNPVVISKRGFASIYRYFQEEALNFSPDFSVIETARNCQGDLLYCQITFVKELDESSPETLKELVEAFREKESRTFKFESLIDRGSDTEDTGERNIREVVDSFFIGLTLLVNGKETYFKLPGLFMAITPWEENE